jgi:DNA helicase HerA-like ATPase
VATKTSYATFILYSLFHSGALGLDAANTKAIIFNVKGEDLLWLDKKNAKLTPEMEAEYATLGLPAGPFTSVAFFAPARKGSDTPIPDTGGRQKGVKPYLWTIRQFCRERLLRFVFVDGEDARAQIHLVISRVEQGLELAARDGDQNTASVMVNGTLVASFADLVDLLDSDQLDIMMRGAPVAGGTLDAFRRRLHAASERMGHLVHGHSQARNRLIDWSAQQVTVVDIHTLHATAQLFVVGVLLKRMLEQKEQQGGSRPLVFVVLDELNKYAPREGWSPLHAVLLDIAERGRSLGMSLFGAQQTASEVERRIVGNAALKVVGRLDAAEAERGEYGFLSRVGRVRATLLRPGSMIVSQPEIPMAVLLRFPFPSWATRKDEAASDAGGGCIMDRMDP